MSLKRFIAAAAALGLAIATPAAQASQAPITTPQAGPHNMADFTTNYLNPALQALMSCFSGPSAPNDGPGSLPLQYQCWVNTASTPAVYEFWDGTSWVPFGQLNATTHLWTPYAGAATGRIRLTSTLTAYVDGTLGVDQPGCGLAAGASACASHGYFLNSVLQNNYDLNGNSVNVTTALGTSYDGFTLNGPFVGGGCVVAPDVSIVGGATAAITAATNAAPSVITIAAGLTPHNGDIATIWGATGNTAINGAWTLSSVSGQTAQLTNGSGQVAGNGAYNASSGSIALPNQTTIAAVGAAGATDQSAIRLTGGACLSVTGSFNMSAANSHVVRADDSANLYLLGPIEFGAAGGGGGQIWSTSQNTRAAGVVLSAPVTALAGNGQNFWQVSHGGIGRWYGASKSGGDIYAVANLTFAGPFLLELGPSDFTETGGAAFHTNGYTVSATYQWQAFDGSTLQIAGLLPASGFFPGTLGGVKSTDPNATGGYTEQGGYSQIFGGATGTKITNNAGSADNFVITDAGAPSFPRGALPVASGGTGASAAGATAVGNISGATPISCPLGVTAATVVVTNGVVTHC